MSGALDTLLLQNGVSWGNPTEGGGDPYWDNVVLYCPFTSDLNDVSTYARVPTQSGTPAISDVTSPFGSGNSLLLDGASYLQFPDSSDFSFDGDFTIEGFIRVNNAGVSNAVYYLYPNPWTGTYLSVDSGGTIGGRLTAINYSGGSRNVVMSSTTWYHFAHYRIGTKIYSALAGNILSTLGDTVSGNIPTVTLRIGATNIPNWRFAGYISSFRITKGVARYSTSNFTPPSTPFLTSPTPVVTGGGVVFPTSGVSLSSTTTGVASLVFNRNGTVQWVADNGVAGSNLPANVNGLTNTFNWYYPNQTDTGLTYPGDLYWIRCVPISGSIVGPTSWTALTSAQTFSLEISSATAATSVFDIQIASDSLGSTVVCDSTGWRLTSSTVGGTIGPGTGYDPLFYYTENPFSVSVDSGTASVTMTVTRTGVVSFSTGVTHNWYTPLQIGSPYVSGYIKITELVGTLTTNTASTIQQINSAASWTASISNSAAGTTKTTTFKVEIFSDVTGTDVVASGVFSFNAIVAPASTSTVYFGPSPTGTFAVSAPLRTELLITLETDGTYAITRYQVDPLLGYISSVMQRGYWRSPVATNIGASYYARIIPTYGSLTGNDCSSVVSLATARGAYLLNAAHVIPRYTMSCEFDVAIYSDSGGTTRVNSFSPMRFDCITTIPAGVTG